MPNLDLERFSSERYGNDGSLLVVANNIIKQYSLDHATQMALEHDIAAALWNERTSETESNPQ